mgnify:FL=1
MSNGNLRELWAIHRYRPLLASRFISNLGNGVAPIGLAFGVLALPDGSPTALSIVLIAQAIPLVLVLPFGGVIADRIGRARVIGSTDILMFVITAVIGVLFLTGTASVAVLVPLQILVGVLNGLWYPAYSGVVPDVVPDKHLQGANGWISIGSNIALIFGTAFGGLLVAAIGSGWTILFDAFTFLIAGFLVWSIRLSSTATKSDEGMWGELVHGWKVFISFRWVVVVVASFSLFVMAWRAFEGVIGPFASKTWYDGPSSWGFVVGGEAVGLLIGALLSTRWRPRRPLLMGMLLSLLYALYVFGWALDIPLAALVVLAAGAGLSVELFMVWWLTALQTHIPRESLSRVGSYDAMGSLMFGPIGLALAGPVLAAIGLTPTLLIVAVIMLVVIIVGLMFKSVRSLSLTGTEAA